jgi:predicted peptidase
MGQQGRTFVGQVEQSVGLDYLLYLPQEYGADAEKGWPLILFLHGMGERGDDLELVKKHGPPKMLDGQDIADTIWSTEFVVVSPQCPVDSFWPAQTAALSALLDEIVESYAVDTNRVYLTGLSMGGYGTWHLAVEYPGRFAAIAPICGGGMFYTGMPDKVGAIANVPAWVFHGARDRVVGVAESADLVYALQNVGADVRFTIYPDAEHDSWTRTYANPDLYEWFLEHPKG